LSGEAKDGAVPAIILNNSSNDENSLSLDRWRVTSGKWVVRSKISSELCGRDDSKLKVWESVRRCKGITCMREATEGRGGLPVKDWVVKMFPIGKGVGEVKEEGGKEGNSFIFLFFSSSQIVGLLCQGNKLFIGCWGISDVVSFVKNEGMRGW
jgi:hypothetical protein